MNRPNWIGQTLGGRYKIQEIIGQGGMSTVYKAVDPNLRRVVAIKLIHPHLSTDPKFTARFEEEAHAVASLRHPNIVQVYDFNHDDDLYYMVQEFVPGETLQTYLRKANKAAQHMSLVDVIRFTTDVCNAIGYAHQQGMIHRDIKPANIMLDERGQAILMDFGIVKLLEGGAHTTTGAVVGTVLYMSPELIRGEKPDARSDIYSLGVTLFEMLSGRPPFDANSSMTLMMMHQNDPVPDLRHIRPEVPLDLVEIVEKSLRKRREERFNSAAEMAVALKKVLDRLTRSQSLRSTRIEYPKDTGGEAVGSSSFPIIILEAGPTPNQEIELRKAEYLIGREAGLDLTIPSPAISRRHARLLRKGDQVQLEDLGSSNGTFVNGNRLSAVATLKPGDEITLGQTIRLRYVGFAGDLKTQMLEADHKDKAKLEDATQLESPPALQKPAPEPKLTRRFSPSELQPQPSEEARPEKVQPDKAPPAPLPRQPSFPPAAVAVPASQLSSWPQAPSQSPALSETMLGDDSGKGKEQPARLVVTIAGGQPQAYLLQGERITIGRGEDNDIPVSFKIVSSHHAVIEKLNGVHHFRVLPDVTNPVFFQGKPLQGGIALRHGDLLRIGSMDPGLMVTLEYQTPGVSISAPPIRFDQNNRVQIGRDPQNDVALDAPTVSRYHAIVERVGQRYRVRDLGSSNGTFVNDQRIEAETWLKAGDWIRIGPFRFDLGQDQLAQVEEAGGMRVEILGLNKWVRSDLNLLKDISLLFQPREFIVVVGQSGGGKSTLLDAVAGFRPATHGQVLVNDIDIYRNFDAIRNEIGFVPQKDIIHMELTVSQALDYAAQLRMPADTSAEERHQRVMEVLKDLDLVHRKDVQISGLSGGQQKRVSIGVELLTKPGLFFLDEPTSGLDPGTETSLMHLMRHLADQGRTIVLITHATKNVMLADKVVFLARGGYIAWFGPPNEALQFFDQFRSERDRKARAMEFDEIYAILDDPSKGKPEDWAERYRQNPAYPEHIIRPLQALGRSLPGLAAGKPAERQPAKRPAHKPQRNQVSGVRQFAILSARNIKILTRDRASLVLMMISAPLVAMLDVLMAVILGRDLFSFQDGDMANAITSLFQPVIFAIMIGALSQMREFVKESEIYRRERLVNLKVLPYVMSKIWVAGLLALYQAAAYAIVHYLAFKMPGGATEFAVFYLTLVLAVLSGMMLGLFASAVAPNANTAPLLVILLIIPQVVVSGALIPMPSSVSAVTMSRWTFEGLMVITGAGSAVAADVCWDLPEEVRESMTLEDKLAQGCRCMGINTLREDSCNFAGLGEFYDPALDEAEPIEPADIGEPPAEPVIPPAPAEPADPNDRIAVAQYLQALQDYQDQVQQIQDEYKAQIEDYQSRADVYKAEMTAYQEKRTEWEVDRNAAVGKAEGTIELFKDNFGWAFVDKENSGQYWSRLVFTWMMQLMMITVLFFLILFAIYRKDRAK